MLSVESSVQERVEAAVQAAKLDFPEWAAASGQSAETGAYEDTRWRLIRLEPHGPAWEARAAEVAAAVAAGGSGRKLLSLSDSKAEALLQGASSAGCSQAAGV